MKPHLRRLLVTALLAGFLESSATLNAQTLTNAESLALVSEVRAKEKAERKNFRAVGVSEYRMNGVKLPDSFIKMIPIPQRTCYLLGKIVEVENGRVVFDNQIESVAREIRCPSVGLSEGPK
jgi:hypothetical protein